MRNRQMRRALARQTSKNDSPRDHAGRDGYNRGSVQFKDVRSGGIAAPVRTYNSINTRGMPAHLVARIDQMAAKILSVHGEDAATKKQAAAHEAGHVVAALALGGKPNRVRIFSEHHADREVWLGENDIIWRWDPQDFPFHFKTDVPRAFISTVITIAGIVGEDATGLAHPSSSIDERCIFSMSAGGLAPLLGVAPMQAASLCETVARRAIEINRDAFDSLRELLHQEHDLDRRRIENALQKCPVQAVFDADALGRPGGTGAA